MINYISFPSDDRGLTVFDSDISFPTENTFPIFVIRPTVHY